MSYEKFITDFLNIEPQRLQKCISSTSEDGEITVRIRLKPQNVNCPYCKNTAKIHGYYTRKLTHSTFANRKCFIVYEQRRYICKECEFTFNEQNPFIHTREQLTYETKINILKDLKHPEETYTNVAKRYNVSVNRVIRLFENHVNIPRKKLPTVLSIDEHYFPSSDYKAKYCCLFMDFISGEIIDVLPDRRKNYLMNYFSTIRTETLNYSTQRSELNNVHFISIDMYEVYRNIAKMYFPKAIVCADSFHIPKHLTDDFNKVRLRCRRSTENTTLQYWLVKLRYIFQHNMDLDNPPRYNKAMNRYMNLRDIREMLFYEFPDLKIAYELKEYYVNLNAACKLQEAEKAIDEAITIFSNCGIPEYDEFYNLLINWRDEVINSFTEINGRRINNSYMESKNRLVEKLIYNASGFRNFSRTRNRILYCLNKKDRFKI